MTPDEPTGEHATTASSPDGSPPSRNRLDPAAMRETLDAARRRLGPPGPSSTTEHSAKELRALLREAAADQASPPDRRPEGPRDPSLTAPGSTSVDERPTGDHRD